MGTAKTGRTDAGEELPPVWLQTALESALFSAAICARAMGLWRGLRFDSLTEWRLKP